MDILKPCPKCLSQVEVVQVTHKSLYQPQSYFFVHCKSCGQGTAKAYPSKAVLKAIWNALATEKHFESSKQVSK